MKREENINRAITIEDVAKEAGVAISTVSRAFNNKKGLIKKETRERILNIAKKLNYTPNALARGLALKRSDNIGIIFKGIDNPYDVPFFSDIFTAAMWEANKNNCNIIFDAIKCDKDTKKWDGNLPKMILEKSVEGVLLCGSFSPDVAETIKKYGVKVVLIENHFEDEEIDSVFVNNSGVGFTATEYLIGLGHKNIAFISDTLSNISFKERFDGYKKALKKYKININKNFIITDVSPDLKKFMKLSSEKIKKMFSYKNKPTAVFCAQDRIAINVIKYLNNIGIRIPDDVSIIGCDDIQASEYIVPPLTTIKMFRKEMGTMGTKLLLERVLKIRKEPVNIKLSYELIERDSCKKI